MGETQGASAIPQSGQLSGNSPRQLLREVLLLGTILCLSLGVASMEARGVVGGSGYFSSGLLLALAAWYKLHFQPRVPMLPGGRWAAPLTVATAGALLILVGAMTFLPPGRTHWRTTQIIHMLVLVPVAEEFYFRGLLLEHLRRGWGSVRAVLICTALFGLLHLLQGAVWSALLLSVAACVLVMLGGSLAFAVQLHVAWNACSLIQQADGPTGRNCAALAVVAIFGIAATMLIWNAYGRRCPQHSM